MNILYIGSISPESTSRHRADALIRLGHQVIVEDPYKSMSSYLSSAIKSAIHFRTGYRLLQFGINEWISSILSKYSNWPNVVWVDSGELIGRNAAFLLKKFDCPLILYNIDDPTGLRDGRRWDSLLSGLSAYDLCIVVREESTEELYRLGAKRVIRVWRSYDEVAHQPYRNIEDIPSQFRSDVAFVGTWMRGEDRDKFLFNLIERKINLSIWGNRWHKSPLWDRLKFFWRGPALSGRDYVAALQGSKIALGLLSKGNRDLHTTRSSEIPYAGGLLCAERTIEHLTMYKEGEEAVFWSDVDECAAICKMLLVNERLREKIRSQGMEKIRLACLGNESIARIILEELSSGI